MPEEDPLKFLGELPKRSSGAKGTQDPDNAKPARARVRRKPGQEPEVIPARPRAPRAAKTVTLAQPCCPGGHPVNAAMKFCPECGSSVIVAGPPKCRNGHEVSATDKFCASCGTPLQGEAAQELLSEDELRSKEAAHRRAVELGKENPVTAYVPGKAPPNAKSVIIHFLVDGFGAFGQVWMRGQEIEVWPGHPRWREAENWITLDVAGQYSRYGRQCFGYGLWPWSRSYTAGLGHFQFLKTVSGEGVVSQPTEEELARADAAELARGRRVPMPIG
jgi:hypothetical protein